MNMTGFDYYADRPNPQSGFTRTAHLIHAARNEAAQTGALTLLFDNGDSLQGTPFGDWMVEEAPDHNPLAQAFNHLGYDAVGLGNHDFSFGIDLVDQFARQLACPLICSNLIRRKPAPSPVISAVLPRHVQVQDRTIPITIGVLSVLPPQTAQWEAHRLDGIATVGDILTTARNTARALKQQGCDIIIALSHSGLAEIEAREQLENAAIPLAAIEDIDAIVAGHTHLTLPGQAHSGLPHVDSTNGLVHGKPSVMPGFAGSHLGVIDLWLERTGQNTWQIENTRVDARPVCPDDAEPAPEAPDLIRLFAKGHLQTRARAARPVGQVAKAMHSYFSACAPDRGLALVAAAQAAAMRPFLAGTELATLPLLSSVAPAKLGGRAGPRHFTDVPAGEISMRHISDLYIFPNELRAVVASGAQVRDWLEMSAGLFNQIKPGLVDELVNPGHPAYNFDVLHGVSYQIDLTQPARFDRTGAVQIPASHRIRNLSWNNLPVQDRQKFVVVLNNYRASGGGNFHMVTTAPKILIPPLRIQDILRDYVAGVLPSDPLEAEQTPFTLAPCDTARTILSTGPGAEAHLAELAAFRPRNLGMNAAGFLQIELSL